MTNYRQTMSQALEYMYFVKETKLLERELTDTELKRREEIAKELDDQEFKDRYGKDWMQVKMGTATKMAKAEAVHNGKDDEEDEEGDEEEKLIRPGGLREKADVSLKKKAEKSGISASILKQVYNRGVAAWRTGHRPGTTPEQWGHARVNSFISKSSGTWGGSDKDLAAKAKGQAEEVELDEAKMSAAQIAKLKKAYEPMRGKRMSMDSGKKLSSIMDKVDDDKQALIQLVKADIPFVSQLAITRLITKHDMKGAEINKLREETVREGISVGKPHTIRKIINGREQHVDVTVTDYEKGPGQRDSVHYTYKGKKGKMPAKTFKSRMVREEVELDEAMSKDMALKILSMTKGRDFKIGSGDRVPMIYLSNADRDELKKEFGRLSRDVPGPNKGATVMQIINLAHSGKDRGDFDTEGGKHIISWKKGGKKIGTPKKIGDAAKIAGLRLEEIELDEVGGSAFGGTIDKIQKVVDDKQATKIDGVMVDTFTASLIMNIFNKVNKQNQDKMRKMKVTQLAKVAYKLAGVKEEVELDEDGHTDVSSAVRKCMTITEDAQDINSKLRTMSPEDSLPSWWTNKLAVASNDMNKMRDYIVNPVQEELDLDERMKLPRQLIDTNKEVMLVKKNKVIVVDKKDQDKYMKQGWILAEEVDLDEGKMQDVWQKKNAKSLSVGPFELIRGKSGVHTIKQSGKVIGDFSYDSDADNFVANMKGMKDQWTGNDIDSLFTHLQKVHKEDAELVGVAKKLKKASQAHAGQADTIMKHVKDMQKESAAADARRAMRRDPEMRQRAFSKDDSATDDDQKAASKNIMMQMRKAQSLKGRFDVEFQDGKKVKIPVKMAIAVQQKYNSMRKPADKEKFQAKVAKSYKDMLTALKEGFASDAQRKAAFASGYKEKGKKNKKESVLDRIDKKLKEIKNG